MRFYFYSHIDRCGTVKSQQNTKTAENKGFERETVFLIREAIDQ